MRNAPPPLTADYDNGKASFTMNANMEQAYKTVYSNYHTPAGTDPKQAPFRLELRYDSAVEPIHLQVYLDTEKEAFTIGDYAIAPAAYTRTYTVTLQANEGTKDAPDWVNVLPLTRQFTVAKKVSAHTVAIVPEANSADYTISLAEAAAHASGRGFGETVSRPPTPPANGAAVTRSLPPSTRIPALLPPQEPRWEPSPLPLRRTTGLWTLPMM